MNQTAHFHLYIIGITWPPETFIERKIDGLVAQGVEVTVCASGIKSSRKTAHSNLSLINLNPVSLQQKVNRLLLLLYKIPRFPVRAIRMWRIVSLHRQALWEKLRVFLQILPLVSHKPDIIHFEWNSAAITYHFLTDILNCPMVVSCRGAQIQIAPLNPLRKDIDDGLPITFEKASAAHCVSHAISETAQGYGLDPNKAWIITPAVDPYLFCPIAAKEYKGILTVLTTGSVIWRKGYEYAVYAIRQLVDKGVQVRYEIIGGHQKDEYNRLLYTINDLDLENHVCYLGKLNPSEVLERLQAADVFLLSSLSEGISNAVLEAMACGIPVVTTDVGGMREAVTDGVEGFVVPPRDPHAIADALSKLVESPSLRKVMGKAGRERILQEFTLHQQTEAYLEMYKSVLSEQSS
ncbi:MAG: glycosyltransferase family 4 protein [Anaerolineales bacterium]|nr:glycosyltransferase family 4 protein [Anaerolineales bacterium]